MLWSFSSVLNIDIPAFDSKVSILITDYLGREIFALETDDSKLSIPAENWDSGMYIISIKLGDKVLYKDKVLLSN